MSLAFDASSSLPTGARAVRASRPRSPERLRPGGERPAPADGDVQDHSEADRARPGVVDHEDPPPGRGVDDQTADDRTEDRSEQQRHANDPDCTPDPPGGWWDPGADPTRLRQTQRRTTRLDRRPILTHAARARDRPRQAAVPQTTIVNRAGLRSHQTQPQVRPLQLPRQTGSPHRVPINHDDSQPHELHRYQIAALGA